MVFALFDREIAMAGFRTGGFPAPIAQSSLTQILCRPGRWPFGKISDKKKNTNPLEQPRIKNSTSTEHSNNSNINSNNTHTTIGGNVFNFITENRSDSDTRMSVQSWKLSGFKLSTCRGSATREFGHAIAYIACK